jgi:hypothetical protein
MSTNTRGKHETELLRLQLNDQLQRLMQQLSDLEELRDEFDDEAEVGVATARVTFICVLLCVAPSATDLATFICVLLCVAP